jgi:hypothetical protein
MTTSIAYAAGGSSRPAFFATLAATAFAAVLLGGGVPARAAGAAQECAYRYPSGIMGQGQATVAEYCGRLRFCQAMADRNDGSNLAQMGCFGFASDGPAAGRRR